MPQATPPSASNMPTPAATFLEVTRFVSAILTAFYVASGTFASVNGTKQPDCSCPARGPAASTKGFCRLPQADVQPLSPVSTLS